jgi:hypothetical protein
VPYPDTSGVPVWARYIGQVVRVATMVYVCRLAGWYLDKRSTLVAVAIFGFLVLFLQETLRQIVVDNIVSDGWLELRWIYLLSTRLPNALTSLFYGAAAVVIARKLKGQSLVATIAAILGSVAIGLFVMLPGLNLAAAAMNAGLGLAASPEVYQMPYDIYVYKYIYGMFIEPTIAVYILTGFLWPALSGSNIKRIITFVVLMLLMRGRILAIVIYVFWMPFSWPVAMAAEGQFFLETLVLAALTGALRATLNPIGDPDGNYRLSQSSNAPYNPS